MIVERAEREMELEKALREIDATWASITLQFTVHEASGCPLISPTSNVFEALDNDQIRVQNALASKYVRFFEDKFVYWRTTLTTVDSVLNLWIDVQRTWLHLETIFKGSADIRSQLPNVCNFQHCIT